MLMNNEKHAMAYDVWRQCYGSGSVQVIKSLREQEHERIYSCEAATQPVLAICTCSQPHRCHCRLPPSLCRHTSYYPDLNPNYRGIINPSHREHSSERPVIIIDHLILLTPECRVSP